MKLPPSTPLRHSKVPVDVVANTGKKNVMTKHKVQTINITNNIAAQGKVWSVQQTLKLEKFHSLSHQWLIE